MIEFFQVRVRSPASDPRFLLLVSVPPIPKQNFKEDISGLKLFPGF